MYGGLSTISFPLHCSMLLFILDLDLSGGSFYADGLSEYLQIHGKLLRKLNLVHVEGIDKSSLALITISCPNLIEFGINHCEVIEEQIQGNKNVNGYEIDVNNIF